MIIEDGTGGGKKAKVNDNNRLYVSSVNKTAVQEATDIGNSYNINTGDVIISGTTALLHFKNNEDQPVVVDAIALGMTAGTTSQIPKLTVYRNPTTGSIVARAAAAPQNGNRNFGSSKTLTVDAYAGIDGDTTSGGTAVAQFYQGTSGRLFATVDFELTKGDSISLELEPYITADGLTCYAALILYKKDENE